MFYQIVKWVTKVITFIIYRVKVVGKENVIKGKGCIYASNHLSNYDVVVLTDSVPVSFHFMAKKEMFKSKFFSFWLDKLNAFPVDRHGADISAMKEAIKKLRAGKALLLFPQGTRVKNGGMGKAKGGVISFAIQAKVPVVPIRIDASYKLFSKITITIGKPITYETYYMSKPDGEKLKELSTDLLNTIFEIDQREGT